MVFLDIETNSKHTHIWCCTTQIGTDEPFVHYEPTTLLPLIPNHDFVAHNGIAFDFHVLKQVWGIDIPQEQQKDTLVLSRLYKPDLEDGHSLDAWGKRLGCLKGEYSNWDNPDLTLLVEYNKQDVIVLAKLYEKLVYEMAYLGFSSQSIELEYKVAFILAKQQRNGWMLDMPHALMLLATLEDRSAFILKTLQEKWQPKVIERVSEKTGKKLKDKVVEFNPNSRDHIAERLVELGWKPKEKTPNGKWIVDEGTLDGVDIPEAKLVNESLMLQKRTSQLKNWLEAVADDGRVHGYVNSIGAVTGRCTHSKPNMSQVAGVNVPYGKEMRQCWTTPKGKALVGVDLSGIELRCLAHYMQDAEYQRELLEGDIHTKNKIAAGLDSRAQAKTFIYALLYGAGPAKIGAIVNGGATDGKRLIDSFMKSTPALKALQDKVGRLAEKGHLPGLDGRRVWVRSAHAAMNTLLQSAGAIVSKQWMIEVNDCLQRSGIDYKQINYSHDEIEFEVGEKDVDIVKQIAIECAAKAGNTLNFRCPVGAEAKVGKNWYDVH